MNGIGATPKTNPNKNIKTALGSFINNGTSEEKAMLAQRNPIAIPARIVKNEDNPNVPVVARSIKKSTPDAIIPMTIGPSFLENAPMMIRVNAMNNMLSNEYFMRLKINTQRYSMQIFAIFS